MVLLFFNVNQPITQFILLIFTFCLAQYILADENSRNTQPNNDDLGYIFEGNSTTASLSQPTQRLESSSIKRTITIIVAVLAVLFFLTSLLLLYVKHCTLAGTMRWNSNGVNAPGNHIDRKNSGMDRIAVESLPLFRFRSLRGQKGGLECAVCLNRFEASEVLRLLPKCKHAFHVDCVDTWLHAHSTCPLCRYRVDPKDILLIEDKRILSPFHETHQPVQEEEEESRDVVLNIEPNPGRCSSVRERESERSSEWRTRKRQSLDGSGKKRWLSSSLSPSGRRLEHRIVVSDCADDEQSKQSWCDLVLVRQDMLLTTNERIADSEVSRRNPIMNKRSVSEITGLSRFPTICVSNGVST